jgi:2-dehydropantoate 2-reductase
MTLRNVCIVGPGAIGGMMAVHLQRAGFAVSAFARPARAAAIAARGITLHDGGKVYEGRPRVATQAADLGPQDLVVVTLKVNALRSVAADLAALCKPDTPLVFVMNGVPWWFFDGFGGALAGTRLDVLDPDGLLARTIPCARIVWGVINCGVVERADGSLSHEHSNQLQLGRPDGRLDGLEEVAGVFRAAGYNTELTARIRDAIWIKLQANITMNPVSALTMATLDRVLGDPLLLELVIGIAAETRAVGERLGLALGPDPAERLRQAAPTLGPSKTSMLQDAERGRPLELDALVAAVVEIGERLGVPMPRTRAVLGLARLRFAAPTGA